MYYIYIMTNKNNNVMYIGVTNDLERRIREHRSGLCDGFTKKYCINKLIYTEEYSDVNEAIAREKQLKGWSREKKNQLVRKTNPTFKELMP